MRVFDTIITRASVPKLTHPAPENEALALILRAALNAPDHGKLRPWRFLIVKDEGLKTLGEAFALSAKEGDPDLSDDRLGRIQAMPLRAPMVIVVLADTQPGHKVPVQEQVVATGAAVQNMLLMAHELGFGTMWRTGDLAYNVFLKKRLGFQEKDEIVAFLYLGTAEPDNKHSEKKTKQALALESFAQAWP